MAPTRPTETNRWRVADAAPLLARDYPDLADRIARYLDLEDDAGELEVSTDAIEVLASYVLTERLAGDALAGR